MTDKTQQPTTIHPTIQPQTNIMTKGNDGKAAKRRAMKQMLGLAACVLVFTVVFVTMNSNGKTTTTRKSSHNDHGDAGGRQQQHQQQQRRYLGRHHQHDHQQQQQQHHGDDDKSSSEESTIDINENMEPNEIAVRYRHDLIKQFESKEEIKYLEDILSAKIHLMEINAVSQELERSPSNSYSGVYGLFCKLNFQVHKDNPASGT